MEDNRYIPNPRRNLIKRNTNEMIASYLEDSGFSKTLQVFREEANIYEYKKTDPLFFSCLPAICDLYMARQGGADRKSKNIGKVSKVMSFQEKAKPRMSFMDSSNNPLTTENSIKRLIQEDEAKSRKIMGGRLSRMNEAQYEQQSVQGQINTQNINSQHHPQMPRHVNFAPSFQNISDKSVFVPPVEEKLIKNVKQERKMFENSLTAKNNKKTGYKFVFNKNLEKPYKKFLICQEFQIYLFFNHEDIEIRELNQFSVVKTLKLDFKIENLSIKVIDSFCYVVILTSKQQFSICRIDLMNTELQLINTFNTNTEFSCFDIIDSESFIAGEFSGFTHVYSFDGRELSSLYFDKGVRQLLHLNSTLYLVNQKRTFFCYDADTQETTEEIMPDSVECLRKNGRFVCFINNFVGYVYNNSLERIDSESFDVKINSICVADEKNFFGATEYGIIGKINNETILTKHIGVEIRNIDCYKHENEIFIVFVDGNNVFHVYKLN